MQSKQYFTKIKNYPHEKSTEPLFPFCEMQTKIGSLPSFSLMEFKTVNLIVAIVNNLLYNSTIQF